jgi:hypothetical protein
LLASSAANLVFLLHDRNKSRLSPKGKRHTKYGVWKDG